MTEKRKAVGGAEVDAFSRRSRAMHNYRSGTVAKLKRKANKRERRNAKVAARREAW
jgi:alpha-D-ribose 1-methylphosphonate 5-triphosphate synthase subunit PhnG